MLYVVMYICSGGTHDALSVETNFPFGVNKIYLSVLQYIHIIQ